MTLAGKTTRILHAQIALFAATWLAGIYVNGFVAIFPGTSAEAILLDPPVALHVLLASLTFVTGIVALVLAVKSRTKKVIAPISFAVLSVAAAGAAGLLFVLGGASNALASMVMAAGFITALYLTFLAVFAAAPPVRRALRRTLWSRLNSTLGPVALSLCYCVFLSGIYVNLFVAGPAFSLPLDFELAAFRRAERTTPFIAHEVLGGLLLASLVLLALSLWAGGRPKASLLAALATLCVAYSAFVGSLNLASPLAPTPAGPLSVVVPMLSATAFMGAIILTMVVTLKSRPDPSPGRAGSS